MIGGIEGVGGGEVGGTFVVTRIFESRIPLSVVDEIGSLVSLVVGSEEGRVTVLFILAVEGPGGSPLPTLLG